MAGSPDGEVSAFAAGDAAALASGDAVALVPACAGPATASPISTSRAASAASARDGTRILITRSSLMVSPPGAFTVGSSRRLMQSSPGCAGCGDAVWAGACGADWAGAWDAAGC